MSIRVLEALVVAAEMTGAELSKPALRAFEMELSAYHEELVLKAIARCRRELKYRITLADIMERLAGADGRPSADEAWGYALKAFDESASVLLNNEIIKALDAARPMLDERDKVGARMAFKSAYERLVDEAREKGEPVHWWPSLGHSQHGRETVINEGVERGLLPAGTAERLLPPPGDSGPVAKVVAGLQARPGNSAPPEEIMKKLQALRDEMDERAKACRRGETT